MVIWMKNMLDELKKLNIEVNVPEGFSKKVIERIKHGQKNKYKAIISTLSFAAVIVIAVLFVDYSNNNKTSIPDNNIEQAEEFAENAYKESNDKLLTSDSSMVPMTASIRNENSTSEQKAIGGGSMATEIKDLLEINGFKIIESNENKVVVEGDIETVKDVLIEFSVEILQKGDNVEITIK
jgi:hypothetical protein